MYTYDEVYQKSLEYSHGDELSAKVFVDKYAVKISENNYEELIPDDMHIRMAKEFSAKEDSYGVYEGDKTNHSEYGKTRGFLTENKIYNYFKDFKYIVPQGSVMSVLGNKYIIGSLSNCIVLPKIYDSIGGIFYADQQLAQLSKRRCGNGLDISTLRPEGMPVTNSAGTTSGAVSFMHRYSNTTREIGQNGRRAALMITIDVRHPDVFKFAVIKKDLTKVTGANISIKLTDDFMQAVVNNMDYTFRYPVDVPVEKAEYIVVRKAKDLWDIIVDSATNMAEPGLIFWDRQHTYSTSSVYPLWENISTNPCQPDFATVLTPLGVRQFKDVFVGDRIWSENQWVKITNKWSTGVKSVYKYQTTAGSFIGTENHRVVSNNSKIEVDNADSIDLLQGNFSSKGEFIPEIIIDGLMIGDGSTHPTSVYQVYLHIGENDQDYFKDLMIKDLIIGEHSVKKGLAYKVQTSITMEELPHLPVRKVPERFFFGNSQEVKSFLRGLFSANGCVVDKRIALKTTSFELLEQVQIMLSSVGIRSYYTTNKPKITEWNNGSYESKQSYDLQISTDRDIFYNEIGFIQVYKMEKLLKTLSNVKLKKVLKTHDIVKKEYLGDFEVFDMTVDGEAHTYWSAGLNISNCSEIAMNNDSCRLIAMNLWGFIINPFTKEAYFDYNKFYEVTYESMHLMDGLVDLELDSVEKIINKIKSDPEPNYIKQIEIDTWQQLYDNGKKGRRTGLGFTALGDVIAGLGFKYDSEEALIFVEKMMQTKCRAEFDSSIDMAIERGSFEGFDSEIENTSEFVQMLKTEFPDVYNRMMKFGRRNISISTIAPGGSLSSLTQTTSGVEPVYLLKYLRRKKINPTDKNARVDFVDGVGDSWQHFEVVHPKLKLWSEITGEIDFSKSPYYGSSASELDWVKRVKLQAICQKYITHSISSTINLPNDVGIDKVGEIYIESWKQGLKGITVYRDGCRTGVLVSNETKEEKKDTSFNEYHAPKRPKELPCDIHHVNIKGFQWLVFVSFYEDKAYEIWGGLTNDTIEVPKSYKDGKIVKTSRGKYDLHYNDTVVNDLITTFDNPTHGFHTRAISTMLRHGVPLQYIVDQIQKDDKDNTLYSFNKVISRVLKKYIKEGTKHTGTVCSNCGSSNLAFQEGCLSCLDCLVSKCS